MTLISKIKNKFKKEPPQEIVGQYKPPNSYPAHLQAMLANMNLKGAVGVQGPQGTQGPQGLPGYNIGHGVTPVWNGNPVIPLNEYALNLKKENEERLLKISTYWLLYKNQMKTKELPNLKNKNVDYVEGLLLGFKLIFGEMYE